MVASFSSFFWNAMETNPKFNFIDNLMPWIGEMRRFRPFRFRECEGSFLWGERRRTSTLLVAQLLSSAYCVLVIVVIHFCSFIHLSTFLRKLEIIIDLRSIWFHFTILCLKGYIIKRAIKVTIQNDSRVAKSKPFFIHVVKIFCSFISLFHVFL